MMATATEMSATLKMAPSPKAIRPTLRAVAASPMMAARKGRDRKKPLRRDWEKVKDSIMEEAVRTKFVEHPKLQELLLLTEDRELVEHTARDAYWGDGGNGKGRNMLGKILMKVRDDLRA